MKDAQPNKTDGHAAKKIVPVRYVGRWVAMAVILVFAALLIYSIATNPRYQWDIVAHYFLSDSILAGLWLTLELTFGSMAIGLVLGVVLAVMRLSQNPVVSSVSRLYITFFRGTPLLVQLIFWFNLSALYPVIVLGIPFGPTFFSGNANAFITPMVVAFLGLGLNEGAYMAEIVRAGLQSVDNGQTEAAQALGMRHMLVLRRVVLPQAMRVIVPPTGNQIINMLKNTSLVSVLAAPELLYSAQLIYSSNFQTIPLLITASLWYLIVTSIMTIGQSFIERHFGKGQSKGSRNNLLRQLLSGLVPRHSVPHTNPEPEGVER